VEIRFGKPLSGVDVRVDNNGTEMEIAGAAGNFRIGGLDGQKLSPGEGNRTIRARHCRSKTVRMIIEKRELQRLKPLCFSKLDVMAEAVTRKDSAALEQTFELERARELPLSSRGR